jgi:hypothetical protein
MRAARSPAGLCAHNQLTGAQAEAFDEEQAVEPIDGEWHSSVLVEPNDGRIPGNAAFQDEAARFRARITTTGGAGGDGPEERRSRELIFEFACHEGNYAVQFILQGFRAQEAGESGAEK